MPDLIVLSGDDEGAVFDLQGELLSIGRNPDNQIVLKDTSASRVHAQIILRGERYYIRDLGSTHGTFVNDVRNNAELLLSHNDAIRIGATVLRFRVAEEAAAHPDAPVSGLTGAPIASSGETIAFSMPADTKVSHRSLSEQRLENLSKVAAAIQSVFDLDQLLNTLMDALFEILAPDRGVIFLCDEKGGALRPVAARPREGELKISQSIMDHALTNRMALLVSDAALDERFSGAKSIFAQAILSAICAPLVSRNKVLGLLYVDSKSPLIRYQQEDLALLNIIAAQAAICIENAMLIQQKLEAERLAAIGVAIAGMAHYVKNVLFGIKGSSSLIETALAADNFDTIKKIWPVLQRSNNKISALVQDMLTYSKKREPDLEQGNLNALALEVYENQAPRAQEAKVALQVDLDERLPDSLFEHKAIHDAVLNLVGNAIEACERRPESSVTLLTRHAPAARQICLSIADNGPGIPEEHQKKIFEPFFSTKGSKGTGLGLAVARKCIEEHGGKLLLESAPSKGAHFHIVLPAAQEAFNKTNDGPNQTPMPA